MKTIEIFNNRDYENNLADWVIVTRGSKHLTYRTRTRWEGRREVTILFPLDGEKELLRILEQFPGSSSESAILDYGWGPEPIKVTRHLPK